MFCKKCGTELSENTSFCKKCGTPVKTTMQEVKSTAIAVKEISPPSAGFFIKAVVLGIIFSTIGLFIAGIPFGAVTAVIGKIMLSRGVKGWGILFCIIGTINAIVIPLFKLLYGLLRTGGAITLPF